MAQGMPKVASSYDQHRSSQYRPARESSEGTVEGYPFSDQKRFSADRTGLTYPPLYTRGTEKGFEDTTSAKDNVLARMTGENQCQKRPHVLLRQIRDTTPLEQKIANHRAGIGVQNRPWACWVIAVVLGIVMIIELVKSVSRSIQTSAPHG